MHLRFHTLVWKFSKSVQDLLNKKTPLTIYASITEVGFQYPSYFSLVSYR